MHERDESNAGPVRIAAVQMVSGPEVGANLATARRWIEEAVRLRRAAAREAALRGLASSGGKSP